MENKTIIRLAHSIEVLAGFLLIGMMFIAMALSDGVLQNIFGVITFFWIIMISKGFGENIKERKSYGLYVDSDDETSDGIK